MAAILGLFVFVIFNANGCEIQEVTVLKGVNFATNSATLTPGSRSVIRSTQKCRIAQWRLKPPSATMICPRIQRAPGVSRKVTTGAMSSGTPMRPLGRRRLSSTIIG